MYDIEKRLLTPWRREIMVTNSIQQFDNDSHLTTSTTTIPLPVPLPSHYQYHYHPTTSNEETFLLENLDEVFPRYHMQSG